MKRYVIIAGVNGAGKSTLYDDLNSLHGMKRICLDEIVRENGGDWKNIKDVVSAGTETVKRINEYFSNGISFNQESTLCGKAILNNIHHAGELGYVVELHFIGLDSPEIAKERVRNRVQHGGHGISDEDIERRYYESLEHLKLIIPMCDQAVIYDNSIQFRRIAVYHSGKLETKSPVLPRWFDEFLQE